MDDVQDIVRGILEQKNELYMLLFKITQQFDANNFLYNEVDFPEGKSLIEDAKHYLEVGVKNVM